MLIDSIENSGLSPIFGFSLFASSFDSIGDWPCRARARAHLPIHLRMKIESAVVRSMTLTISHNFSRAWRNALRTEQARLIGERREREMEIGKHTNTYQCAITCLLVFQPVAHSRKKHFFFFFLFCI